MGRTALTPEQRADAKQRIADAALALFHEGGLKAVTMRAVAARMEVAPSWLYLHYHNRNDLLTGLWADTAREMLAEVQRVAAAEPHPLTRIRAVLRFYARFADENPDMFRAGFLSVLRPDQLPDPLPPSAMVPFHALLVGALEEAAAQGLVAPGDHDLTAQALWAATHGAAAIGRNLPRFPFRASGDLAERAIDTAIRGLRAS